MKQQPCKKHLFPLELLIFCLIGIALNILFIHTKLAPKENIKVAKATENRENGILNIASVQAEKQSPKNILPSKPITTNKNSNKQINQPKIIPKTKEKLPKNNQEQKPQNRPLIENEKLERSNTQAGNMKLYYHFSDHLGSSSFMMDESGKIVQESDYYAYGIKRHFNNLENDYLLNRKQFTGKEQDATGLYYFGARYMDPEVGRWTQPDPVYNLIGTKTLENATGQKTYQYLANPQNLNAYSYALNNPIRLVDPNGKNPALAVLKSPKFWGICAVFTAAVATQADKIVDVAEQGADYLYGKATESAQYLSEKASQAVDKTKDFFGINQGADSPDYTVPNQAQSFSTDQTTTPPPPGNDDGDQNWGPTKPNVSNSELKKTVDELYRPTAKVGNGGTGDAYRYELRTGRLLSKSGHLQKVNDSITRLTRIVNEQKLSKEDIKIAKELIQDLKNALSGK